MKGFFLNTYNFLFLLLFFLIIANLNPAISQIVTEEEAHNAEKQLQNQPYKQRIENYSKLISFYSKTSLEKARVLSVKMIDEARLQNDKRVTADGLTLLGRTYVRMGLFDDAEQTFSEALKYFQQLKSDSGIAAQYGNLGVVYDFSGDFKKAVKYYHKALRIYETLNDIKNISFIENNLGIVYQELNLFDEAFSFQQRALGHKNQLNDTSGMASTLNNIGVLYESLKSDLDSALIYYQQSLLLYQMTGNIVQTATLLNNIGLVYLIMDSLPKASEYLNKALMLRQNLSDMQGEASTLLNLSRLALGLSKPHDAIEKATVSLNLFMSMNSKAKIAEACQILAKSYEIINNYPKALDFFKLHMAYRDTVLNESNQKAIHEMQARYEHDAHQNKIALLAKDNAIKEQQISRNRMLIAGIVITFILLFVLTLFFIRNFKLKQKQHSLVLEQKLFRTQMNPHFVFNALSSIQSFVKNNSSELGSKYITQFARLMRKILENSAKDFVPLSDELEVLNDYLTFQKLRFSDAFTVAFDIDEAIEAELTCVPPMLLQPFIENAIEHGVRHVPNGEIKIELTQLPRNLKVLISDNGAGINKMSQQKTHKNHQSMALQITQERLLFLSKSAKSNPSISIVDKSDHIPEATGTVISFEMPVKLI